MSEVEKESQADRMVKLVLKQKCLLFTDQYGNPYIQFLDESSEFNQVYSLKSGIVRDWFASLLYKSEEKVPGGDATSSALSILRAKAREGPQMTLYNRVAPDGADGILIDMANKNWQRIHITKRGWFVDDSDYPIFNRFSHQKALPHPVKGGDPLDILRFVNLKNEEHRLLYIVAIISYFIPEIQHPIILIWGPHGSGKSLAHQVARAVIDPSVVGLLHLPRVDRELVQQLYHNYLGLYDNLSSLPDWASDIFCRAVTGAGNTKRQLYMDDDDIIYEYRRCLGLNGINISAQKPDLLDRTLILQCEMLDNHNRLEEREMARQLEEAAPLILGGILDAISKALSIYSTIQLGELPRLADFTHWGCAITEALGMDRQLFLDAVTHNIRSQSEEALRASLIATALVTFMENHSDNWIGTPETLYDALCNYANDHKISTRQKSWPKNSVWMIRRLNEAAPSLSAVGITLEIRGGRHRTVTIGKTLINDVNAVMPSYSDRKGDGIDGKDSSSQSSPAPKNPDSRTLISQLINEMRVSLGVGELWPRHWLEQHGIPRQEAEQIIVGLYDAGKIRRTTGGWEGVADAVEGEEVEP
jgi:hypothetical protein